MEQNYKQTHISVAILMLVVGHSSRGRPEGSLFYSYYIEV